MILFWALYKCVNHLVLVLALDIKVDIYYVLLAKSAISTCAHTCSIASHLGILLHHIIVPWWKTHHVYFCNEKWEQETHGPWFAHLSKTALAYLQLLMQHSSSIATATRTQIWPCMKASKVILGSSFDFNLIVLGFNDTSTLMGHFVSSPREREKRDRRDSRRDERERQGRKRNRNESKETEEIKTSPPYPYLLQG